MRHILNIGIVLCILLPFLNTTCNTPRKTLESEKQILINKLEEKGLSLNQIDSLKDLLIDLQTKIEKETVKPAMLKWFEHITKEDGIWRGYDLIAFPPISIWFLFAVVNLLLGFRSVHTNQYHKLLLWVMPLSLASMVFLQDPYDLMYGYWIAFLLSSFKLFRQYVA